MTIRNIGFACMSLKCNTKYKTFRLANFNEQRLYQTVIHNIKETERTIRQCVIDGVKMFRLSSDIVPFATHEIVKGIDFMSWIRNDLRRIGELCKDNEIRYSMHPSQIVNINSPNKDVVKSSVKDLIYHYNILNSMRLEKDDDFNIIIHVGGMYGDKTEAIKRFIKVFNKLPEQLRNHIILENDDKSYTINDVMEIHKHTGLKIVLDLHHYYCCNDGSELDLKSVFDTWNGKIPKIHISSPKSSKEFRSHADMIDFEYCKDFLKLSEDYEYDIMIEAKGKDLAVEKFKKDLIEYKNNNIDMW